MNYKEFINIKQNKPNPSYKIFRFRLVMYNNYKFIYDFSPKTSSVNIIIYSYIT